jgi:pimeloyl-ACP methyl ester carboxylesterase
MRLKMVQNHLVLLPGLDGTGRLFASFRHLLPICYSSTVVSYPGDTQLNYQQLIPKIRDVMPWEESYTLVAESFAGPLALQFADAQPEHIRAIILVASFVRNPIHPLLDWGRFLVKDTWLQKPLPLAMLKKFFAGEDCPPVLAGEILDTVRSVRPEVLAHRIRMALEIDVSPLLRSCEKPILYLAGTQDKIVGKRGLETIRALKPDVASVEIDAPHLLLQRRPGEAVAVIQKFLEQEHLVTPNSAEWATRKAVA